MSSVRIRVARMHHPYLMIRKYRRASPKLHFWHVATYAVFVRHGAAFPRRRGGGRALDRARPVAGQANPVVIGVLANQFHVRIVASRAAYALVVSQEAPAVGQA